MTSMYQSLNIPLTASKTTRRDSRRVVALVGGIVFGACVGLLAFRVPFAVSTTVSMAPADATTIRIIKTNSNVDTLTAHIGTTAIFPGSPWTFKTLLTQSKREMTIILLPNGEMAYIIDAPLTEPMQETADAFGMSVVTDGKTTAIAAHDVFFETAGHHVIPSALIPWHDGEAWDAKRRGAVVVNEKGMTLRHVGIAMETVRPTVPAETKVNAYLSVIAGGLPVPEAFRSLLASPMGDVLDLLSESGGTLILAEDRLGDAYILTTAPGDLTSEEMAEMGKDIMNRSSLSTQPWTLQDGSVYEEIVGSSNNLALEIRAEEDFTYVSLKDPGGSVIRMTKTPDTLTIANREIDVLQGQKATSSCLRSAHSWLRTSAFSQSKWMTTDADQAFPVFMRLFQELAVSNGKVRLCW